MNILAHRGYWTSPSEKNKEVAIRRAFSKGLGVETDLRDFDGEIVISHDIPQEGALRFEHFLQIYSEYMPKVMLALNIKSDGLHKKLVEALNKYKVEKYFVFDMSIPDTIGYLRLGVQTFLRRSEFESGCALDERVQGLWLDALEAPYVNVETIKNGLMLGRPVAIVSPELHGRPHEVAWSEWRGALSGQSELEQRVMLCTDLPEDATEFFKKA